MKQGKSDLAGTFLSVRLLLVSTLEVETCRGWSPKDSSCQKDAAKQEPDRERKRSVRHAVVYACLLENRQVEEEPSVQGRHCPPVMHEVLESSRE